ncbi:THAP domain-containing protein 3 isoform X2 [Mycetomoellerius zeteki]|uniref:THAP domain-containing protein 3 isoform X2 n=1 Tax=Mycetomoellerius zeteki TaxID=64791 RepID=UPI00084E9E54|nr:PREDICTED: THAP domain-containing protein 3-like isoform X2 [Trachymyrmex zeteki]
MRCCVPGCGQYSQKGISFHRFPQRDKKVSQLWVDQIHAYLDKHNCERGRLKQNKLSVLCSNHFVESDYFITACNRTLKFTSYPSVFSCDPNAPKVRRKSSSETPAPPAPQLRYILPKVKIDELECTKIMATEYEEENKEDNFGEYTTLGFTPQESEEIFKPQGATPANTPHWDLRRRSQKRYLRHRNQKKYLRPRNQKKYLRHRSQKKYLLRRSQKKYLRRRSQKK